MSSRLLPYLLNCFWLVVPVLVIDGLFTSRLPAAYQPEIFWRDIPAVVAWPENVLRFAVIALTVVLPLPLGRFREHRAGIALYVFGIAVYGLAWLALIAWPASGWSTSVIGFSGPAWAPLLWLAGIGLIAGGPLLDRVRVMRWAFWLVTVAFVGFHLAHTLMVFSRVAGG